MKKQIEEEKNERKKERNVAQESACEKILISAHRWKVLLVVVLLFLCRYADSFKYRSRDRKLASFPTAIFFFLRGITEGTDNILWRLLSIFALAYSNRTKGLGDCSRVLEGIFSIAAILCHDKEPIRITTQTRTEDRFEFCAYVCF